jgi:hypothetical protein
MVWVKYWHSFLSTGVAALSLTVPWKLVEAVWWLWQRVTDKRRNEEHADDQEVEAANQDVFDREQELKKKTEAGDNASKAREDWLVDLEAKHDVALWFDIVQPVGLSCVHILARFVHGWQRRLEAKGSKERGTWKQSGVKWKLFIAGLSVLYGALPFYWWLHNVLPEQTHEHEGSGTAIDVYQKHERIVLLASIGLTLYGLGLIRYWIELQRQGTGKSTLFAPTYRLIGGELVCRSSV